MNRGNEISQCLSLHSGITLLCGKQRLFMKIIKLSTRIKFLLVAFFLCMMAMFLFVNRNEIFWKMLKKKNCDVAVYDFAGKNAMPFAARFFYQKSKNEFLISKFGENEKVSAEFLGWPLQEGDLAWCIWSGNTLTENDFELLARKLNLNTGFEIFRYVYGNNERKLFIVDIVSEFKKN